MLILTMTACMGSMSQNTSSESSETNNNDQSTPGKNDTEVVKELTTEKVDNGVLRKARVGYFVFEKISILHK